MRLPRPAVLVLCVCASGLAACSGSSPSAPQEPAQRTDRINPTPVDGSVRLVWFVPTDVAFDSSTAQAIARAAHNVQSWYRALLGGTTFRIDDDFPVEVVFGDHDRAWYADEANPWGWDPIWNANYWVDLEVKRKLSLTDWSPLYKVAVYMSAEGGGGSSNGRLTVPQHDVDGIQKGVENVNRFWGGLAHELGHTFDLPDASGDDGSIMSGAMYAYPDASLLDAQKTTIVQDVRNAGFFTDEGPAFEPGAYYLMIDSGTGMAADLQRDDTIDGEPVVQHDSTGAETEQWTLERQADGTYRIRNRATKKLLVVRNASGASGAKIEQESDGDAGVQSWYVLSLGSGTWEVIASYDIVANQRTEGLAVPAGATAGTQLVQQDFVTAARQSWRFVQVQ